MESEAKELFEFIINGGNLRRYEDSLYFYIERAEFGSSSVEGLTYWCIARFRHRFSNYDKVLNEYLTQSEVSRLTDIKYVGSEEMQQNHRNLHKYLKDEEWEDIKCCDIRTVLYYDLKCSVSSIINETGFDVYASLIYAHEKKKEKKKKKRDLIYQEWNAYSEFRNKILEEAKIKLDKIATQIHFPPYPPREFTSKERFGKNQDWDWLYYVFSCFLFFPFMILDPELALFIVVITVILFLIICVISLKLTHYIETQKRIDEIQRNKTRNIHYFNSVLSSYEPLLKEIDHIVLDTCSQIIKFKNEKNLDESNQFSLRIEHPLKILFCRSVDKETYSRVLLEDWKFSYLGILIQASNASPIEDIKKGIYIVEDSVNIYLEAIKIFKDRNTKLKLNEKPPILEEINKKLLASKSLIK